MIDMWQSFMSAAVAGMLFISPALAEVRELPSPAAIGSGQPNLAVSPDGRVYLSWLERQGEGRYVLRFAVKENDGWSAPRSIAEGANWFVNWADFPSMIALPDGSLAAHWLVKSGPGTYAYDVHISRSNDGGESWSRPFLPHRDGTATEHGFASLFTTQDGSLAAVWLDGRETRPDAVESGHEHDAGNMTLRFARIESGQTVRDEALLDARACDCCQTSAALTSEGPVVVYRDRSDHEVRDTSIVRLRNGQWSEPHTVFADNWVFHGCPVNGPSVAASGRRVAVAWFTAVNDVPRVKLAFSNDAGGSFGEPIIVDDGKPLGRVETLMLEDGSALVSWLEMQTEGSEVRVRRIRPDGKREPAITVTPTGSARSNGFPQMVSTGGTLVLAWTEDRVRTAEMPLP